jgi:hypothetical protein
VRISSVINAPLKHTEETAATEGRAYMTLIENETRLNSLGKPWDSLKDSFAAARDRQIESVHGDATIPQEWKADIEQTHRDNYARLVETLVKLANR